MYKYSNSYIIVKIKVQSLFKSQYFDLSFDYTMFAFSLKVAMELQSVNINKTYYGSENQESRKF